MLHSVWHSKSFRRDNYQSIYHLATHPSIHLSSYYSLQLVRPLVCIRIHPSIYLSRRNSISDCSASLSLYPISPLHWFLHLSLFPLTGTFWAVGGSPLLCLEGHSDIFSRRNKKRQASNKTVTGSYKHASLPSGVRCLSTWLKYTVHNVANC